MSHPLTTRPLTRWVILVSAVVLGTAGAVAATSGPGAHAVSAAPGAAHLRVVMRTTSNWTELRIETGQVVAQKISATTGAGRWRTQAVGPVMNGGDGQPTTVTDDLVIYDRGGDQTFRFRVLKGYRGITAFSVANCDSGCGTANTYTDSRQLVVDPTNSQTFVVPRSAVLTSTPPTLPRADGRHLVLADYYPWWPNYDDARLADRPSDPRSTDTYAGVQSMTAQAKANGINGFIVSWDGQQGHGEQFELALRAAEAQGQLVTGYLEAHMAARAGTTAVTTLQWLQQLLSYSSSSAFLKASDGVPVVFVFDMSELSPDQWSYVLSTLKSAYGESVHLVGDTNDPRYSQFEWGFARYDANSGSRSLRQYDLRTALQAKAQSVVDPQVEPKAFVGTVSPGFNDHRLRGDRNAVVPRDAGTRYTETWSAALFGQPDWILVTSWNEWYEGTAVEPGVSSGSGALKQTADEAGKWRQ